MSNSPCGKCGCYGVENGTDGCKPSDALYYRLDDTTAARVASVLGRPVGFVGRVSSVDEHGMTVTLDEVPIDVATADPVVQ